MDYNIFVFAALLFLIAFFSASEMAFFSLPEARLRTLIAQKKKNAVTLQSIRNDAQKLLITILIGNNLVIIGGSAYATVVATERFGNAGAGIATGAMTVLILYFGEIIPKSIAQKYNAGIGLFAAPIFKFLMLLMSPAIWLSNTMTVAFQRLFGLKEVQLGVSEDDVRAMVTIGHEEGSVESGEREMIERVFLLNDITAEDVMTPDDYMVGFEGDDTIESILPKIQENGYSRYPVYHGENGDVQGIVYIKDVFNMLAATRETGPLTDLVSTIMKPASFVPGTMHVDDLLKFFQKKHQHIAMVVDEYGTVLGLVTLEDLLEEIVGEIIDETDVDSDLIQRVDKTTIMLDPRITIGKVNTFFNTTLKGSRHKTIGWLLLREFGRIPHVGDTVLVSGYTFTVDEADERKMKRVKMQKKAEVK